MRLITLTTDFGTRDSYVAEMKGLLYREGAEISVVDLSHDLRPFDVPAAAWFLRAALPAFPDGTVHVAVIDPGVGSARAPLIVELPTMTLVGPDNGSFTHLFDGREVVYRIEPERLGARAISRTFHGRDVFAPAAAKLSLGVRPDELGTRVTEYVRLELPVARMEDGALIGCVLHVDHFGNVITNLDGAALEALAAPLHIEAEGHAIAGVIAHYAEASRGEVLALIGSSGRLEIAVREGSAAKELGLGVGSTVIARPQS